MYVADLLTDLVLQGKLLRLPLLDALHTYSSSSPTCAYQSLERLCREVQAQAALYRESVRNATELADTTGVELFQGSLGGRARPMVVIKQACIRWWHSTPASCYNYVVEERHVYIGAVFIACVHICCYLSLDCMLSGKAGPCKELRTRDE